MTYSSRPVYTSPRRDIGINTLRIIGCSTKSAADMPPIHAIHSLRRRGISLASPTDAEHTNSGAHSHIWKLKLKKKTMAMLTIVSVTQKACVMVLPRRA